jgi:hypothetical protein
MRHFKKMGRLARGQRHYGVTERFFVWLQPEEIDEVVERIIDGHSLFDAVDANTHAEDIGIPCAGCSILQQ